MTTIIVQNQIVALENQAERIQIECMNTIRKKINNNNNTPKDELKRKYTEFTMENLLQ